MPHLARFEQSSLAEDRDAMLNARRMRMLDVALRMDRALDAFVTEAWGVAPRPDDPALTDADCDALEARAAAVEGFCALLVTPAPVVTEQQRREIAEDLLLGVRSCENLFDGTTGDPKYLHSKGDRYFMRMADTKRAVAALLLHGLPEVKS